MTKKRLIRITTVPISLEKLLEGQLPFMQQYFCVTAISADKEKLEKLGKFIDVPTYHLDMSRKITPFKDIKAVFKLYRFLTKEKPTIVHTHTPKAGTVGMLAAKLAGVPHRLHTIAGLPLLEATGFKRTVLNTVEKLTYSCATNIYPNSLGLKNIIVENNFCNSNKLKVLANGSSNGIDTAFFNPDVISSDEKSNLKKSLGILDDDFVFIFVGRLVGDKGINELISAFKKLQLKRVEVNSTESNTTNNQQPTTKLLLVGPLETDLDPLNSETLYEINTNENIISVGFQPDVRPYFAIANALVFPSYREGFPNVVMQAGAMGLPSIVTNINGCNEIITDSENGMIIPVKNANAIYVAMKKMMEDESYCMQLQQNARPMIVTRYEQHVVWEAILAEYKSLEKTCKKKQ